VTSEDVLKARLKTLGAVEHAFTLQRGTHRGITWKIYDVGGARNQRQAWAPFFEDGGWPAALSLKGWHERNLFSERYHLPCTYIGLRSNVGRGNAWSPIASHMVSHFVIEGSKSQPIGGLSVAVEDSHPKQIVGERQYSTIFE